MNRQAMKSVLVMLIIAGSMNALYALEVVTHKAINRNVALSTFNGFSLDLYLINQLGFNNGYQAKFNSLMVSEWLRDGGEYEDKPPMTFSPNTWVPYVRSANHFHNPIKPINHSINEAGFTGIWGTGIISGKSAIAWAQSNRATQSPGGYYSWNDSRNYFYNALIASNPDVRSKNFADTFRGLGQLMHLLQDMSVPAHTRNEGHYVNYMYENWVKNNAIIVSIETVTPVLFDYTLLTQQPSAFSEAPVPIANLFSTNNYKGATQIAMSDTTVGLAEWTNANFFSEDTINLPSTSGYPTTSFPFPNFGDTNLIEYLQQRAVPETIIAPNGAPDTGIWVQKINARNEVEIVHFAKFGYTTIPMANLMGQPEKLGQTFILDDECYRDYAEKLLPRAIGYSAGLLNYFFRGALEIAIPDIQIFGIADGSQTPYLDAYGNRHQQFTTVRAKVRNTTINEVIGIGTLQAVARYKVVPNYAPDLSNYPPSGQTMLSEPYSYSVSSTVDVASISSTSFADYTFNFDQSPIPAGITDLTLQVVFKGTIGNEVDNAIAVGMRDISEPTHLVFWNLSDRFSYGTACVDQPGYLCYKLVSAEDIEKDAVLMNFLTQQGYNYAPTTQTFSFAFKTSMPTTILPPVAQAIVQGGEHARIIALVDGQGTSGNFVQLQWQEDYFSEFFYGAVSLIGPDGSLQSTPTTTFRYHDSVAAPVPFTQHFDTGIVQCYPELPGGGCPYPESDAPPADPTPVSLQILIP